MRGWRVVVLVGVLGLLALLVMNSIRVAGSLSSTGQERAGEALRTPEPGEADGVGAGARADGLGTEPGHGTAAWGSRPSVQLSREASVAWADGDGDRALELNSLALRAASGPGQEASALSARATMLHIKDPDAAHELFRQSLAIREAMRGDAEEYPEGTGWNEAHHIAIYHIDHGNLPAAREVVERYARRLTPGGEQAHALGWLAGIARRQGDAATERWALEQLIAHYASSGSVAPVLWRHRLRVAKLRDPTQQEPSYLATTSEIFNDTSLDMASRLYAGEEWLEGLKRSGRIHDRLEGMVQLVTLIDRAGPSAARDYESTLRSMFSDLSSADAYGRADLALWALARSRAMNAGNELLLRSIDAQEQLIREKLARQR